MLSGYRVPGGPGSDPLKKPGCPVVSPSPTSRIWRVPVRGGYPAETRVPVRGRYPAGGTPNVHLYEYLLYDFYFLVTPTAKSA